MRMTILALALALLGCAGPTAIPANPVALSPAAIGALVRTVGRMPQKDQSYSGAIVLAGRTLPLPPGAWEARFTSYDVAASGTSPSEIGFGGTVILVQRQGQSLRRALVLSASAIDHHAPNSVAIAGPCANSDVLRSDVRAAGAKDAQDCVSVFFVQQSVPRALYKAGWPAVDAQNLIVPPTFVVGSIRLVSPDAAISADLLANPDLDGVPVDAEPNRVLNGWARERLDKSPARKAFVERLDADVERYRIALLAALAQTKPIPAPGPRGVLPGPGGGEPRET